jgi:hypothetical protein
MGNQPTTIATEEHMQKLESTFNPLSVFIALCVFESLRLCVKNLRAFAHSADCSLILAKPNMQFSRGGSLP